MVKNFGKLIELNFIFNNEYEYEYESVLDGWHYSEKWVKPVDFLSNNEVMI